MATHFISRVEREPLAQEYNDVGPGQYRLPSTLRNNLPGFAPFASNTSKNEFMMEWDHFL